MKGSPADAKTCALRLLGYRSRSKKEILDRLKRKGFSDEQINNTVCFLEKAGLISDEALAAELFRYSTERKSLGKRGVEAFLLRRGIDKELVNKTLSKHSGDLEEESAGRFVEKKLKSMKDLPCDVIRRRLWGMLQRRGFSPDVINRVVETVKYSK
ncbi:MAG: regulatory protein RecX [Nitrospirae bacterium]|nr:regulatory protein RecX [Nitrospirota bacterium]